MGSSSQNLMSVSFTTPHDFSNKFDELVRSERKITNQILQMINIAYDRRIYLDLGYPSLFEWLTKKFGYSNAAAYRRIEAAKLLISNPEIGSKLESGSLNLSILCKVQSALKKEESLSGEKVSKELKAEVILQIENKNQIEAEKRLFELFPKVEQKALEENHSKKDQVQVLSSKLTSVTLHLDEEAMGHLKRLKEILSHKFPDQSESKILAYALKSTSLAEAKRVKKSSKHLSCSFKDPVTGKVCGSRYQVQTDHIQPKALGGSDHPRNLRPLCRSHNLHAAEKRLGSWVHKYRKV